MSLIKEEIIVEAPSSFRMIHVDKLISAVRSRPALYSRKERFAPKHRQRSIKQWKEVCRELNPAFDGLTRADKLELEYEVYKRWRSLRTCFTRELALQKKEKLRTNVKRRKRYEHYDALTFLLQEYEADFQEDSINMLQFQSDDESAEVADFEEAARSDSETAEEVKEAAIEKYPETEFLDTDIQINELEKERNVIEKNTEREKNDDSERISDKLFMLSLVPSFRRINPKRKLAAKIELMKVLQAFQED